MLHFFPIFWLLWLFFLAVFYRQQAGSGERGTRDKLNFLIVAAIASFLLSAFLTLVIGAITEQFS